MIFFFFKALFFFNFLIALIISCIFFSNIAIVEKHAKTWFFREKRLRDT